MSALYYFGIIEGALHAKGEEAYSIKVWHAMKMLADELKAPHMLPSSTPLSPKVEAAITRGVDESNTEGEISGRWQDWQIELLKTMKASGEKTSDIAVACEKTQTQINNKWHSLKSKTEAA